MTQPTAPIVPALDVITQHLNSLVYELKSRGCVLAADQVQQQAQAAVAQILRAVEATDAALAAKVQPLTATSAVERDDHA